MSVDKAVASLRDGGVIAYPTEGVFGLGCLPDNLSAVQRLLDIKARDAAKGLILLSASADLLQRWIELPDETEIPEPHPHQPTTWIVPAAPDVSPLIRGQHSTLAVRITTHAVAAEISARVKSPIISTSANLSGQSTARDAVELQSQFGGLVDYIVPDECGDAVGPSKIVELVSGKVLRQATTG